MDQIDLGILRILQGDCSIPISKIANQVGLSSSPCWKRINRMEKEGLIKQRRAILDNQRLGLGITVFVNIKTGEHSSIWLKEFSNYVTSLPEVVEVHRISGQVDYMLKVIVPDMESYDAFYKKLIGSTVLGEVPSHFTMETIKETPA